LQHDANWKVAYQDKVSVLMERQPAPAEAH
jgi:hypothetical protein